ncbi:hypothetical protein EDB92DRAFT_1204980 [Lactarius akahatsu]|uniref:F-box domain-containing protein n=1 Tax=Lactarius akahatsu TaxID=416441 RepID=A0AAD4LAT7_9AGAM|nr:hypothetical protein EDB92DRAFT_1204980 [Lactarius akahatsu]
MPFAGIHPLPFELLEEIMDYVATSPQEILTLRRVSKTFCSLVTPTAFREIVIHTTDKSTQGFLELLASADVAKHVRVIQIIEDSAVPYSVGIEESGDERYERVWNRLKTACSTLHLIPALESLVFTFLPDEESWMKPLTYDNKLSRYQLLHLHVLEGLACNPNPLPALRSLQIDDWFAYPDECYAAAPFQRIVASLRDLRFLVQDTNYKGALDRFLAEDFWADVIGPRVLLPAANLETLSMSCNLEFGSLFRLNLRSITFPCLTSLSLSNFVWDDVRCDPQVVVPEAEDFIVRHGKTLKKLELHNCAICVPQDRPRPVRSWAAVWNRFANELSELVDLVVEFNFSQQYVYFFPLCGFDSDEAFFLLRGTEQDSPALQGLFTVVEGRKGLTSRDDD